MFAPEDALRHGYLDRVLSADQLDGAVEAEVARLRTLDMPSFAGTKSRLNAPVLHAVRAAVEEEMRAVAAGGGGGG
jgi:enoyl-CoA hydratase